MIEILDAEALDELVERLSLTQRAVERAGEDSALYDRLQALKPQLRRATFLTAYLTRQLGG